MARAAAAQIDGEVPKHDFDLAATIYRRDIKPALSKVGEFNQEASTGYKAIKKQANIQPSAAKLVFKLYGMEDAKRSDFWRCVLGLADKMGCGPVYDLVDQAEAASPSASAPRRTRPNLAAVPLSDGKDEDLAVGEE